MFHKQYYKLEEAAQKLGVDVETILDMAIEGIARIAIYMESLTCAYVDFNKHDNPFGITKNEIEDDDSFREGSYDEFRYEWAFNKVLSDNFYPYLNGYSLTKIRRGGSVKVLNSHSENIFDSIKLIDVEMNNCFILFTDTHDMDITIESLIIPHEELTRLLALKAEHDGKPTAEQLQQQLGEANARIAELEAAQTNDTKQPIQQQREQALLFWVEGMGRDTVMTMTKPQIHEALKKIDSIFHFSDFDKFWQKQQVIKLEAGKPTRNIG
jgi:hypothetical protein